jgi:hypothetical protein
VVNAAGQTAQGIMMGTTAPGEVAPGFTAYHGSPHSFDAFDTSKIGTGEGAQAYGHGLYFAGNEGVARSYRDQLAGPPAPGEFLHSGDLVAPQGGFKPVTDVLERHQGDFDAAIGDPAVPDSVKSTLRDWQKSGVEYVPSQSSGSMYQVQVNADPAHFLDWDQTVGQHPPAVRDKLLDMGYGDTDRGADVYSHLSRGPEGDVGASQRLQAAGIPGIRYLDAGSRASGQGTSNHVVFDANTIDILRKYGIAGLMAGGGAAAAGTQQQPSQ